jgi:hypothetical protein
MCKNSKSVYHLSEQVFTICPAYTGATDPTYRVAVLVEIFKRKAREDREGGKKKEKRRTLWPFGIAT